MTNVEAYFEYHEAMKCTFGTYRIETEPTWVKLRHPVTKRLLGEGATLHQAYQQALKVNQ